MKYGELNLGQIEAIVNKLGGMKGVKRFLSGETGVALNSTFPLTVDYNRSVEARVKAGRYDAANSNITSQNFSSNREGKAGIIIELVHFHCSMESKEVLEELAKRGLRPAELSELLAFGEQYPDVQQEFPIIALGSVWRDLHGSHCVGLWGFSDERRLGLYVSVRGWNDFYRFAAVRK